MATPQLLNDIISVLLLLAPSAALLSLVIAGVSLRREGTMTWDQGAALNHPGHSQPGTEVAAYPGRTYDGLSRQVLISNLRSDRYGHNYGYSYRSPESEEADRGDELG